MTEKDKEISNNQINKDNNFVKIVDDNSKINEISNKKIYFIYAIFFLINVVINMSNGTFSTLMNTIKKELDIKSDSIIGFISSIFFLGQVLGIFII